jgi:hypothetical protein
MVSDLVYENHWHYHNQTCWKYLRRGEAKDDAHCRMRIDGSTTVDTQLDSETGTVLLRRLHPRINSYNDVLTFLTQSNNDIKFIGSGQDAKALVYYITDYITKASLPTHVALSALRVAMDKNTTRFGTNPTAPASIVNTSLFVKCANGILSRQEMSHQQVVVKDKPIEIKDDSDYEVIEGDDDDDDDDKEGDAVDKKGKGKVDDKKKTKKSGGGGGK